MKKKDKLDYIYFCAAEGRRRRLEMVCRELSGIRTLRVCITEKSSGSARNRRGKGVTPHWKRIRRRLKGWKTEDCTVGADWRMAEWLQMKEELFLARKQELMQNRNELLERMGGRTKEEMARKSFLLVLDSNGWSRQDLLLLLSSAKDYFADIYMVTGKSCVDEEQMVESMYEEWGVVLHLLSEESARTEVVDCAFFLLESWNDAVWEYNCRFGYVVSECENGMNRCRNSGVGTINGRDNGKRSNTLRCGRLYSGMVYKCRGEEIPYQMAVNLQYQNPEKYHKFSITSVAIYCVE